MIPTENEEILCNRCRRVGRAEDDEFFFGKFLSPGAGICTSCLTEGDKGEIAQPAAQ